jgi:amidophosphoribosyltransferase
MRAYIGADSLAFLSVDGIYQAMGYDSRDDDAPQFTDHCFTGEYPTRLSDREGPPAQKQLSFLAEVG